MGIPDNHEEHTKLMFDLMALSYQADITRISSFMMAREVSYRTFPMIGVPEPFHPTSHHQNDPDRLEKLTKINTYHVGLMAYFLEKLQGDAGWRRQSAGSFADPLWQRHEQQQRAQSQPAAGVRGGRRGWQDEGRQAHQVSERHADGESAADHSGQSGHASSTSIGDSTGRLAGV